MRLLVVSQYFWPENFRINDLVAELVERGHQVTVLTGYPNYPDGIVFPGFSAQPAAFAHYRGADVIRVPLSPRGRGGIRLFLNYLSFALSASIIGGWKLRGRAFDALLAFEPSPITVGIPAAVLRSLKNAPMAFWVLDLWPETLRAIGVVRSEFLLRVVGTLVSSIYARCDLVLAQSRSFVPQIVRYCRGVRKVVYFPSWAESVFVMDDVEAAPELPVVPHIFTVMFAGNIGEAQDFPAILDAAELLKFNRSIRWVLVGDGRMSQWVAEQIAQRTLDNVIMLGRYPVERMPSFYKHADALLVSLKAEPIFAMTIPGKLQSYLAAGIPIVAMLNGEGADLIRRAHAGATCDAGDGAGLAHAVQQLVALSPAERAQMGRNAGALSSSEFDRSTLITKLEDWLALLAARRRDAIVECGA